MTDKEIQNRLLRLRSKYLLFEVRRKEPEPFFVIVTNRHGHQLGQIDYSLCWRQYVLSPYPDTMWSADCLNDVIVAMTLLKKVG